jgi:segregation and condensation protein B
MSEPTLKQILEGAILAADTPLSIDQLSQLFTSDAPERAAIKIALEEISADCQDRGFELKQVASGYRFQVRHELGEWVSRLWEERPPRYSRALLETLALIAYRQPITRGDIEEIRGVSVSTNIMRSLLEREWVRIVGHRDVPGRPAIYATTRNFLDYFNLKSLEELPTLSEIRDMDKVNEELDLAADEFEIRSLDLIAEGEQDQAAGEGDDKVILTHPAVSAEGGRDDVDEGELFSEDLDRVSKKVEEIQQNIKAFVRDDSDDPDDLDEEPEDQPVTGATAEPDVDPRDQVEQSQQPDETPRDNE